MKICEKLTVKDGWVNGFTQHPQPNHTRSRACAEIVRWAMIIRQHGPPDQPF